MAREWIVLSGLSVVVILLAWWLVPREKIRDFQIVFLFAQTFTWLEILLAVEFGTLHFPVREFPYATDTGFTIHFLIYPTLGALLALHYPEQKSRVYKGAYYLLGAGVVAMIPIGLDRYTNYLDSVNEGWLEPFAVSLFFVVLTNKFYRWFRQAYRSETQKEEGA